MNGERDDEEPGPRPGASFPEIVAPAVEAVPGLVRIAATSWLNTTEWGVRTSLSAMGRLSRAATDRDEADALVHDVNETARGVAELARSLSAGVPLPRALSELGQSLEGLTHLSDGTPGDDGAEETDSVPDQQHLRQRGADLLDRSRDVWDTEVSHPAYERILDDLAPDEARILVLVFHQGPQPAVDVRTGGPLGAMSSTLVAPGLTMIGARAGCRHVDAVPSYLHNLFRLGLVWFSREQVRDPVDYQVLEAQPDVVAAMRSVRHAKVVRRSISLTPFGDDFCRAVLVDQVDTPPSA